MGIKDEVGFYVQGAGVGYAVTVSPETGLSFTTFEQLSAGVTAMVSGTLTIGWDATVSTSHAERAGISTPTGTPGVDGGCLVKINKTDAVTCNAGIGMSDILAVGVVWTGYTSEQSCQNPDVTIMGDATGLCNDIDEPLTIPAAIFQGTLHNAPIIPGQTHTVQTPSGPVTTNVMETIMTPDGPKQVWKGSHGVSSSDIKGPAGGSIPGSSGNSDRDAVSPSTGRADRDQAGGGTTTSHSNTSGSNSGGGVRGSGGEGAANNGHGPTSTPRDPSHNPPGNEKDNGRRPILLDLNGNGVQIADLSKSTQIIDSGNDGLKHRTAWAASGDGVLFFDADNDSKISQTREYVFTEWDPTAKSDMQALRARFDSNNDGKLTAADAAFAQFKVMVTQADGSQIAQSLTQLGITEIRLTEDATKITLTDGSMINGQSSFVMNGVTRTVASAVLMAETQGYRVVEAVTLSGTDRVVVNTGYGADGKVAATM